MQEPCIGEVRPTLEPRFRVFFEPDAVFAGASLAHAAVCGGCEFFTAFGDCENKMGGMMGGKSLLDSHQFVQVTRLEVPSRGLRSKARLRLPNKKAHP